MSLRTGSSRLCSRLPKYCQQVGGWSCAVNSRRFMKRLSRAQLKRCKQSSSLTQGGRGENLLSLWEPDTIFVCLAQVPSSSLGSSLSSFHLLDCLLLGSMSFCPPSGSLLSVLAFSSEQIR